MTIQKLELRQRELLGRDVRSVQLSAPGQEATIVFPVNGEPSQHIALDVYVGAETHRITIHLPTSGYNVTQIAWVKV